MSTHIALLRGINVGGRTLVSMAELRNFLSSLGLKEVRTLLQSGNVIFRSNSAGSSLEKLLEKEIEKRFHHQVDFFIRSPAEWSEMIERNPFPGEAVTQPGYLVCMLFKKPVGTAEVVAAVKSAIRGGERFQANGREAFIYYPVGQGQSKFTNAVIERKLGLRGTIRNWNTVRKLAALAIAQA